MQVNHRKFTSAHFLGVSLFTLSVSLVEYCSICNFYIQSSLYTEFLQHDLSFVRTVRSSSLFLWGEGLGLSMMK